MKQIYTYMYTNIISIYFKMHYVFRELKKKANKKNTGESKNKRENKELSNNY